MDIICDDCRMEYDADVYDDCPNCRIDMIKLGPKLLEALGVPIERCIKATITIEANKPIIITSEYLDKENLNISELIPVVKKYKIEEIGE